MQKQMRANRILSPLGSSPVRKPRSMICPEEVSRVLRTRATRRTTQKGVPSPMAIQGMRAEPRGQEKDSMSM